jgi:multidrug efflux pump subunit AcrA (membrane-fusion protein)
MKKVLLFLFFSLPFVLLQHQAYAAAVFEGIVKPVSELELSFAIDGVISKIFVKEGDLVKKGDLLIKLDDTLQKLEVERRKQIYQDHAEMEANKKNLVILKSLLDSNRTLYEKTASVSYDELRNIEMQYHTLLGKVNLNEERKKQEQIEYEISKEMLSRYIITAPMDGMVTSIKREESEWVKRARPCWFWWIHPCVMLSSILTKNMPGR